MSSHARRESNYGCSVPCIGSNNIMSLGRAGHRE